VRLRQVAFAARALEPAVDALRGRFGLEVAFRDPGVKLFGLRNAVLPVGSDFLEVVSPERPDAPAARWLERRGDVAGGYMLIVQVDDLAAARARVLGLGVRIVFEHAAAHTATIHLHPRDVGGAILSLDASEPAEAWDWAGPDWKRHVRREVATGIAAAELAAPDPDALAARWGGVLDRGATPCGDGAFEIALDGGAIRFTRSSGEEAGVAALTLRAAGAGRRDAACTIGSTRIALGT
jgi:hypothetical protein